MIKILQMRYTEMDEFDENDPHKKRFKKGNEINIEDPTLEKIKLMWKEIEKIKMKNINKTKEDLKKEMKEISNYFKYSSNFEVSEVLDNLSILDNLTYVEKQKFAEFMECKA